MDDEAKAARDNNLWLASNVLKFWSACPTRRCRRARSCVGDPAVCHAIFWPVVPEEVQVWWRTLLDSHRTGRTATQAGRAAGEAMAQSRKRAALMQKLQPK